jgi:hypothetical protein
MSDRLTAEGLRAAIEEIEAFWPAGKTRWADPGLVLEPLRSFSDETIRRAVRRLIHSGREFQPGPVDLLREAKAVVADDARARIDAGDNHPSDHVWLLDPVWPDEAVCAIAGCGAVRRALPGELTRGEAEKIRRSRKAAEC